MICTWFLTVYATIYFYPNWYKIMECYAVLFIAIQGFANVEADGLNLLSRYIWGVLRVIMMLKHIFLWKKHFLYLNYI